jgi:hypothetical protein
MLRRLLLLALSACTALAESRTPLFDQVGPILMGLSEITGWKVERKVPAEILKQTDFRRFMQDHMKDAGPKELRAQEITLKMFGLVPQDFNLAGETVDLMSEQAAAFYDYNKKKLFVLDSTPDGDEQRVALVHELAHALADQHHPLGKYMREGSPDDDASTARQAVMEGQATWLTWAYLSFRGGGPPEVPLGKLDQLASSAGADGPVYSKAPLYIRESLVFPYNQGIRFLDAVYRKFGRDGFDEVFHHPPASTLQILHPDAYFASTAPTMPMPPGVDAVFGKDAHKFHTLTEGALGEFDFSALLRQYLDEKEGAAAAAHLRGAAFRLFENKSDKNDVLTFVSDWESPEAAETFYRLYVKVMKAKWKKMDVASNSATEVTGSGDSGKFQLRLSGNSVQCIEGMR